GGGGVEGVMGNVVGRDRKGVRHGRGMDRAGDGAGDDDLVGFRSHWSLPICRRRLFQAQVVRASAAKRKRRFSGSSCQPKRPARNPQMPFGTNSITAMATAPSMRR